MKIKKVTKGEVENMVACLPIASNKNPHGVANNDQLLLELIVFSNNANPIARPA